MAYDPNIQSSQRQDDQKRAKVSYANKLCCHLSKDMGMEICSWESLPGWRDYVDGKIDEVELNTKAESEIAVYQGEFKGFKPVKKSGDNIDPQKRRMKIANKIYQKICTTSGNSFCFFKNFASWSDYVNGHITEDEFIESARLEMLKIQEAQQAVNYLPK